MMSIIPVEGGQYRFRYKSGDNTCHIGIFHSYIKAEALFQVDLYVEAFTPSNAIDNKFISLIGLPDIKRREDEPTRGVHINDINILHRLYICKNSVFQEREIQWRLGMNNLYRISDDEIDEHLSFIGYNYDDNNERYINEEHQYLIIKLLLVKVNEYSLFIYLIITKF